MFNFRKALLYDTPRFIAETAKSIVTFPHRAIFRALNYNKKLDIYEEEYDWFESNFHPQIRNNEQKNDKEESKFTEYSCINHNNLHCKESLITSDLFDIDFAPNSF